MVCDSCEMVFASPMPGARELSDYNARYFASAHGGAPRDAVSVAFHSAVNRLRVAHVEQYAAKRGIAASSVLEVGAGAGHFARHWLASRPGSLYYAIESDTSMHGALTELGVQIVADAEMLAADTVDIVVMSHVLEHTIDPAAFLRAVTLPLRRGGTLFVEVPCRDFEFKALDEPHLLFFDKGPLGRLLTECGFGDCKLTYHGVEIAKLRADSNVKLLWARVRAHLLARGVVAPFARAAAGLEVLERPLERAAVAPFEAHRTHASPAAWLRAVGSKL